MNKRNIRLKMSIYKEMIYGIILILLLVASRVASAEVKLREAEKLMNRAKVATGGGWNHVNTADIFYMEYTNGTPHEGEEKIDFLEGRFLKTSKWAFPRGWGWDGNRAWSTQNPRRQYW